MSAEHIEGRNRGDVMLYALSTCHWCRKTKELLGDLGVGYSYTYVDLLEGDERAKVLAEITRVSGTCSFPTLIVGAGKVIVGFREAEIREALA